MFCFSLLIFRDIVEGGLFNSLLNSEVFIFCILFLVF